MDAVFLGLIALTIGAGVAGALVTTWKLHRRTLSLEYRTDDLEQRLLTVKNREKSEKRWSKKQETDDELEQFLAQAVPTRSRQRFANDPIEEIP